MTSFLDAVQVGVDTFNEYYWYVVIVLLIVSGLYFTIRTVGVQFRLFPEMLRSITEKPTEEEARDGVSAFRAFTISAASRVGTGNIAGCSHRHRPRRPRGRVLDVAHGHVWRLHRIRRISAGTAL